MVILNVPRLTNASSLFASHSAATFDVVIRKSIFHYVAAYVIVLIHYCLLFWIVFTFHF